MKAYEAIKRLKVDRKEFLEQYGIKSHMSKIPPELEAELFGEEKKIQTGQAGAEGVDSSEAVVLVPVVEEEDTKAEEVAQNPPDIVNDYTDAKECPYTLEEIALGLRCLGSKGKMWEWRHLLNG
jgi:hypothetical protein